MRLSALFILISAFGAASVPTPSHARPGDPCINAGYPSTRNSRNLCPLPSEARSYSSSCRGGQTLCNPVTYGFGPGGGGICTSNAMYATTDCERQYSNYAKNGNYGSAQVAAQLKAKNLEGKLKAQQAKLSASCDSMTNQTGLCRKVTEKTRAVADSNPAKVATTTPAKSTEFASPPATGTGTIVHKVPTTSETTSGDNWLNNKPPPAGSFSGTSGGTIVDGNAGTPGERPEFTTSSNLEGKGDRDGKTGSQTQEKFDQSTIDPEQSSSIEKTSNVKQPTEQEKKDAFMKAYNEEQARNNPQAPKAAPAEKTPEQLASEKAAADQAAADKAAAAAAQADKDRKAAAAAQAEAAKKITKPEDGSPGKCFQDEASYAEMKRQGLLPKDFTIPLYMKLQSGAGMVNEAGSALHFEGGKIKSTYRVSTVVGLYSDRDANAGGGYLKTICVNGNSLTLNGKAAKKATVNGNGTVTFNDQVNIVMRITDKGDYAQHSKAAEGGTSPAGTGAQR